MAHGCEGRKTIHGHPCFGGDHRKNGRIHLPVAPRCNITCRYCTRRHDCVNESRPGVTSKIMTPDRALEHLRQVMISPMLGPIIKVVGIAGPGDPLANHQTFETLRLVREAFPGLKSCLSTNGLLLPDRLAELADIGLTNLTVTVNCLDPEVGNRIYSRCDYHGRRYSGTEGAELLIRNQLSGIERAADLGMVIKVNSILIPGINDGEIPRIAREVAQRGAAVMNITPLIPQAEFAHLNPPTAEMLNEVRAANQLVIGQISHCRQCRADAVGLIDQDEQFIPVSAQPELQGWSTPRTYNQ